MWVLKSLHSYSLKKDRIKSYTVKVYKFKVQENIVFLPMPTVNDEAIIETYL